LRQVGHLLKVIVLLQTVYCDKQLYTESDVTRWIQKSGS